MKILHVSDTHVGYGAYNKLDDNGYNQRESDFNDAFRQVVDFALKHMPDLVLHSGDVFDSVRPTNRAISFVLEQVLRLSKASIPFVMIAGNHETPRLRETGSVFRVFEHIDGVFPVYQGRLETLKFGELKVHALPHCIDKEVFDGERAKLKPDSKFKFNVAMLHAGIVGIDVFKMGEFNEQLAETGNLHKDFDYIALGHYHEHCKVTDNSYYAGSTERAGFGEVGQPKGFVTVDLDSGDIEFHELAVRNMIDLKTVDCSKLGVEKIMDKLIARIEKTDISGSIIRINLNNIRSKDYHLLDVDTIRKLLKNALHFQWKVDAVDEEQKISSGDVMFDSLEKEFGDYLAGIAIEGVDKEALRKLGLKYLKKAGGEA